MRDSVLEQRRAVLDRCHLELATLDLDDCEEIGHQVARELGVGYHEDDAEASGEILWLQCIYATVDEVRKRPAVEGIDLAEDSEPEPPKGERQRRLINEGSLAQAREERLQCTWATKFKEELELCDAPVLAKLKGSLDPDRAILALAGKS